MQAYDVIVVGGGNAALCAAISAHESGARVAVLERAPKEHRGGNSAYTGGAFRIAYRGVEDLLTLVPDLHPDEIQNSDFGSYTEDQFFQEAVSMSGYRADADVLDAVVSKSLDTMQWMRGHGVRFVPIYGRQSFKVDGKQKFWGGLTVEVSGGGLGLMEKLYARAEALGMDLRYGARDLALMRSVASFRISAVLGLPPPPQHRGDPAWLARHALRAMEQNGKAPDLILMGREHGDLDDGMAAAYLADSWQLPFIGLTLDVHIQEGANGCLSFRRSGIGSDESITLPMPAFASVSNDKSNRLRHPLMKNVMLAKQQSFPLIAPQADETPSMKVTDAEPPAASARGTRECRILQGSLEEQALELAAYLKPGENTAHP